MQLGVGGHRGKARMPDGVEHVEIMNRVLCGESNPTSGLQAKAVAQGARKLRHTARKLPIAAHDPLAQADRGQIGVAKARALEP
jgi:hypothetical protein